MVLKEDRDLTNRTFSVLTGCSIPVKCTLIGRDALGAQKLVTRGHVADDIVSNFRWLIWYYVASLESATTLIARIGIGIRVL